MYLEQLALALKEDDRFDPLVPIIPLKATDVRRALDRVVNLAQVDLGEPLFDALHTVAEARFREASLTARPRQGERARTADPGLSRDARTLQINFADHVEGRIGPEGDFKPIMSFANKIPEHAARMAGVLTIFEDPNADEIQPEYMLRLAQHYAAEALRLGQATRIDQELRLATTLL